MKRILLFCSLISLMSGLMCMEKVGTETFKKERKKPIYYIAPEIKERFDEREKHAMHHLEDQFSGRQYREQMLSWLWEACAVIVNTSGKKMSNQAKLEHLVGDPRYPLRKKVIKEMIEKEDIHPDDIIYRSHIIYESFDNDPLHEAVLFNDVEFATYLLNHGADARRPFVRENLNQADLKPWLNKNKEVRELLESHLKPFEK